MPFICDMSYRMSHKKTYDALVGVWHGKSRLVEALEVVDIQCAAVVADGDAPRLEGRRAKGPAFYALGLLPLVAHAHLALLQLVDLQNALGLRRYAQAHEARATGHPLRFIGRKGQ